MFRYLIPLGLLAGAAQAQVASGSGAVLRALDKLDGVVRDFEVDAGRMVEFGNLDVAVLDCRYPASNPTGEAYARLDIRDHTTSEISFQGWMVASSPALNPLDHSRYDVWVIRCTS